MPTKVLRPGFNFNLEALRGFAAVVVVWHHLIYHHQYFDPNYMPTGVWAFNPPGPFAVNIFFLLSGFVIGKSHPEPLTSTGILPYLRKRFVRLYPIYVLAVLAGAAASGFTLPLHAIGQHLYFWASWGDPIMFENNPLWSLQYEVVFYLAFVPLSLLAVRPWVSAFGTALLGIGALFLEASGFHSALAQFLIGFSFWAVGWALSALPMADGPTRWPRLLSALLLLLSIEHLDPLTMWATQLTTWLAEHQHPVNSHWALNYAVLPYAVVIVLGMAGVRTAAVNKLSLIVHLLPLYGVVHTASHWAETGTSELLLPCVLYLVSLGLYFTQTPVIVKVSKAAIQRLIPIGAISYGIYVIHFPILFSLGRVKLLSGSLTGYLGRLVVYLLLTFLAATWLDRKFQPWIKRRLG